MLIILSTPQGHDWKWSKKVIARRRRAPQPSDSDLERALSRWKRGYRCATTVLIGSSPDAWGKLVCLSLYEILTQRSPIKSHIWHPDGQQTWPMAQGHYYPCGVSRTHPGLTIDTCSKRLGALCYQHSACEYSYVKQCLVALSAPSCDSSPAGDARARRQHCFHHLFGTPRL
jgi:hypothetical protein